MDTRSIKGSKVGKGVGADAIALYVHIPFCQTKCPYCDFNTYSRIEPLMPSYIAALRREVEAWGAFFGDSRPSLKTVFFGGGTPSYLPSEDIVSVARTIHETFEVALDAEVTLEANPGDFTPAKLTAYLDCGINRLSIGVQSLSDRLLQALGRRHSAADAIEAYRMASDAGFKNISIDLMYGLPHQTIEDWRETLDGALALSPRHVSMYCLTLEEGTPLEAWVRTGKVPEPDPDLAADMYLMAQDAMRQKGYCHYEISNWAIPGFESRHNLTYWRNQTYLGVGPGAHSYLPPCRFFNLKSPREYVSKMEERPDTARSVEQAFAEAIRKMPVVADVELIDRKLEMAETLMMGLRLDDGVSIADFARRFGEAPAQAYGNTIAELASLGLIETAEGCLRLTPRGRILGNEVFRRFFE
ncbi:MAG: radical SAM family heme chaperone HemW [Chloroflexi bacterium]|nr:radical SAM family heme chaperone HemW [Chloroflexota bacterium]